MSPHIFVPKAVNEGIQYGDHDDIKHSCYFDQEPWTFGIGHTIEEDDPKNDAQGSQLGGTGGQDCLGSPSLEGIWW